MITSHRFALLLIAVAPVAELRAKPDGTDLVMIPTYSWSSNGDLTRGGKVGEVSVQRFGFEASEGAALTPASTLRVGLRAEQTNLDRTAGTPLPETLRSVALELGAIQTLDPQWTLLLSVRPGQNADTSAVTRATLNIPVMAVASYEAGPDLTWSFGARYDSFSSIRWLPFAGVRWQFAPDWTFAVGYPRGGITWRASPDIKLGVYAGLQGGGYRITHDPRPAGPTLFPVLKDSHLETREIRTGVGADFTFSPASSLRLDAGFVTSRNFEYVDRAFRLRGDPAAFGTAAVHLRF